LRAAKVAGSDRTVYLHNEVVVSNGDIASARAVPDPAPPKFRVDVQFTASGTNKMRATTAAHIGKPVALLLDGEVVLAPTLRSPISNTAVITGNFSQETAETIAKGVTLN
jgi:preprotein translocase subunit SecD